MNTGLLLIFMVLIGALIGGMTNFLAIKMLFRPYEAVYIGKFKLPFTPGLIPKRRAELAEQLGRVVTDYLVTSDALEQKVLEPDFQQKISVMINQQIDQMIDHGYTLQDLILKINPNFKASDLEQELEQTFEKKIKRIYEKNKHLTISEVLPNELHEVIESQLPEFTSYVIQQIDQYLTSEEGQRKISESASKFLQTQGFLGNMVSSYLGEDGLAEKITPAIKMFLSSNETHESIQKLLEKEWIKFKEKDLESIRELAINIDLEERIAHYISNELNIKNYLEQPIGELFEDQMAKLKEEWVPKVVEFAFQKLSLQMSTLLEQLNLFDLVKQEVETFDVSRIERLVLEITKREMNMITYLGALLGGFIGLIQGVLVLLIT
ncbi:DUF445 domain-containing protein [Piscibacillus halophilus]|uniref:Uncharacterized membrane protein YheB, UPF0754 family n=1 Tax=Piscibacillus halophilus TaxID=571933 RepID=A0A1H9AU75_9BACI|nr:DUF445 family protein [Piscibacillus halophilus]SEP80037.1 Uncharacterized membrane protein YheB, UPF0754 family [Piscibacillus halophilus]